MAASRETENLKLPLFDATDKPSWLGDWNGAMGAIDLQAGTVTGDIGAVTATANAAKTAADAAQASVTALGERVTTAESEIMDATGDISSLEADVQQIRNEIANIPTINTTRLTIEAYTNNAWSRTFTNTFIPQLNILLFAPAQLYKDYTGTGNITLFRIKGNPLNLEPNTSGGGTATNIKTYLVAPYVFWGTDSSASQGSGMLAYYSSTTDYTYLTLNFSTTTKINLKITPFQISIAESYGTNTIIQL